MIRLESHDLARVLNRLPYGVLVVNADCKITYVNVTARRLLHPANVRIGEPVESVASEPTLEALAQRMFSRRLVRDEEVRIGERTLTVEGSFDPEEHRATLVINDVSARARRVRSEEDFVINASHEILGPVAAIAGAAQVLQDGAKDDPQARDRFIGHIVDAADRLTSTATALLVLAKSEAGLGGPRLELVPVRPVLEDVGRGKDDVTLTCPDKVGVLADADLFRQTVAILVENARRHSRAGVGITVDEDGEMVSVDILDTGSGILPEDIVGVTDRFSTSGGEARGYGVGLSIATRAAKVLGGDVDLTSDRSGTRARLRLPSARLL